MNENREEEFPGLEEFLAWHDESHPATAEASSTNPLAVPLPGGLKSVTPEAAWMSFQSTYNPITL